MNRPDFQISKTIEGLFLEGELLAADYLSRLDCCKSVPGAGVQVAGVEFAPSDEFVRVSVHLDDNTASALEFLDMFLGIGNPRGERRRQLSLILDDLSKSQVGSFVKVPEECMGMPLSHQNAESTEPLTSQQNTFS